MRDWRFECQTQYITVLSVIRFGYLNARQSVVGSKWLALHPQYIAEERNFLRENFRVNWDSNSVREAHNLMEGFGYHLTTKGKGWNISGVRLWFCKPSLWIPVMTHSIIPPQLWTHSWSFIARVEVECMPLLGVHFSGVVLFRVLSTKHDSSGDLNVRHSTLLFYRWYDLAIWMPDSLSLVLSD